MESKKNLIDLFTKIKEINYLPENKHSGTFIDGIIIVEQGVFCNSHSSRYPYEGQTDYSFLIKWEELDKSIEYFKQKFNHGN